MGWNTTEWSGQDPDRLTGNEARALAKEISALRGFEARHVPVAQGVAVVEGTLPDGAKFRVRSRAAWNRVARRVGVSVL